MKKLLALLLALTGFALVSCNRGGGYETYYGTINAPYEEKTTVSDSSSTLSPEETDMNAIITENTSEE